MPETTKKIEKAVAGYQYRPETQYRCEECVMLKPLGKGKPEQGTEYAAGCAWFGPDENASPLHGSCIYFAHAGPDHPEIPWLGLLTKIELGYTENKYGFSCKRCEYFDIKAGDCEKVDRDSEGDTPGEISPNGCCNFWEGDAVRKKMTTAALLVKIAAATKDEPMPNFLETTLQAAAKKKGLKGREADRYVYGAMNNMGAMRGNKVTTKGKEMERKHRDKLQSLSSLKAA